MDYKEAMVIILIRLLNKLDSLMNKSQLIDHTIILLESQAQEEIGMKKNQIILLISI